MQTTGLHIDNPLSLVNLVTSPLTGRTSFAICWDCYFIAENCLTILPVFAKCSHHPPLHVMPRGYKEGKFAVCLIGCFTAENKIKQSAYSISQSATLTALFTKESLALRIVCIKSRLQTNILNLYISLGSTVQGELAALAV